MAAKSGMPDWPLVKSEVVRQDVADEELAQPTMPELVSAPEAADILGVSTQRVHELARGAGFPEPVYVLKTGKLWLRSAMEAYAVRRPRKPGRRARGGSSGGSAIFISSTAGPVALGHCAVVRSRAAGLVIGGPLPYGPPSEAEETFRQEVCQAGEHFARAINACEVGPFPDVLPDAHADVRWETSRLRTAVIMSAMLKHVHQVRHPEAAETASDVVYVLDEKDGEMEIIEVKSDPVDSRSLAEADERASCRP
jgi:hypothetical protein